MIIQKKKSSQITPKIKQLNKKQYNCKHFMHKFY